MASAEDKEIQDFVSMETQKAQLREQMNRLTDVCWDKCMDKPKEKLDYKQESCMSNCVERFIDTSLVIAQRFQSKLDKLH